MDVPLWAFLLASGFAVVGPFLASVITARHQKGLWEEERKREHATWLRERKYETYGRLLSAIMDREKLDYENPGHVPMEEADRRAREIMSALIPAALVAPVEVYDLMGAAAAYTSMEVMEKTMPNVKLNKDKWPTTSTTSQLREAMRRDLGVVD